MKCGARKKLSRAHCTQFETQVRTLNSGRAAYGGILILTWGRLLKGEILMLILGGLHERHAVKRGIWVPTQHLL
jgi:hypothetical protein